MNLAYNYEYPGVNMNDYNNDWLINKVKELACEWLNVQKDWTDMQTAYDEMKNWIENYFKNLDVQEEINNKLESMISSGEFQRIISNALRDYINPVIVDSIEDMSDRNKMYILKNTGELYYYNGTNFVSSGIVYGNTINTISTATNINISNYSELLPDLNEALDNSIYFLNFGYNSTDIPVNYPFSSFLGQVDVLLTIRIGEFKRQLYIANNRYASRIFIQHTNKWLEWTSYDGVLKYDALVVTSANYLSVLPDLNNADDMIYMLNFNYGSENLPNNMPFECSIGAVDILLTLTSREYKVQYYISKNIIKRRIYTTKWSAWVDYFTSSGLIIEVGKDSIYQYNSILKAVLDNPGQTIYVHSGVYDVIQEFTEQYGSSFADFTTEYEGIIIYNGTKLYMSSGADVQCIYNGNNERFKNVFSPFKFSGSGGEIHGGQIHTKNCRYAIHDDVYGSPESRSVIEGMFIVHDNPDRAVAIGGGFGKASGIDVYNNTILSLYEGYSIFYHNNPEQSKSMLNIYNNVCDYDIVVEAYGTGNKENHATVCNNKARNVYYYKFDNIDNIDCVIYNNKTEIG